MKGLPLLLCAATLSAQTPLMPLADVRAGLKGTGKTVFSGDRIEEFQVEILGTLENNSGPKQSLILGRLSGGPLAQSGVLQGMSGSPVYIQGKLVGAVATTFAFSKEPIAGIRPIHEMLQSSSTTPLLQPRAANPWAPGALVELIPARHDFPALGTRMVDIATPVSLSGFTQGSIAQFAPQLRALGLEPAQGTLGGGRPSGSPGDPSRIQPGSMISIQLVTGDLAVGADGTVTLVDGKRIHAFGHRLLSIGATDLPFARSEVLTLLPTLSTSFKISAAREWMGAITSDRSAAVTGELGRRAAMVPVTLSVRGSHGSAPGDTTYRLQLVRDRLLTPFLLQMAVFTAIDATERSTGSATISVRGRLDFDAGPPVEVNNIYAADTAAPLPASLAASVPLSYAMQSGFPYFQPRQVTLAISVSEEKKQYHIDHLWASRHSARPGQSLDIHLLATGPAGATLKQNFTYTVPIGAPSGQLQITAADAMATNLADYAHTLAQPPSTPRQVTELLKNLKPNNVASVRLYRTAPSFLVQGQHLPDPPPSLALLLRRQPGSAQQGAQSRLAEFIFTVPDAVISGSKSIQVEVKE